MRRQCFFGLFGFGHKWGTQQCLDSLGIYYRQCQRCGAMRRDTTQQQQEKS